MKCILETQYKQKIISKNVCKKPPTHTYTYIFIMWVIIHHYNSLTTTHKSSKSKTKALSIKSSSSRWIMIYNKLNAITLREVERALLSFKTCAKPSKDVKKFVEKKKRNRTYNKTHFKYSQTQVFSHRCLWIRVCVCTVIKIYLEIKSARLTRKTKHFYKFSLFQGHKHLQFRTAENHTLAGHRFKIFSSSLSLCYCLSVHI